MKKQIIKMFAAVLLSSSLLTSCYVYTTVVGEGAKGTHEVQQWNSYVLFGLVPVNVSDPKVLADGAKDYTVTTKQSFVNGLVSGITFGIYAPTTTIVKK
jgi:hypothetical protein